MLFLYLSLVFLLLYYKYYINYYLILYLLKFILFIINNNIISEINFIEFYNYYNIQINFVINYKLELLYCILNILFFKNYSCLYKIFIINIIYMCILNYYDLKFNLNIFNNLNFLLIIKLILINKLVLIYIKFNWFKYYYFYEYIPMYIYLYINFYLLLYDITILLDLYLKIFYYIFTPILNFILHKILWRIYSLCYVSGLLLIILLFDMSLEKINKKRHILCIISLVFYMAIKCYIIYIWKKKNVKFFNDYSNNIYKCFPIFIIFFL